MKIKTLNLNIHYCGECPYYDNSKCKLGAREYTSKGEFFDDCPLKETEERD